MWQKIKRHWDDIRETYGQKRLTVCLLSEGEFVGKSRIEGIMKKMVFKLAKSYKEACPLSNFFPVQNLEELKKLEISLKVNGQIRQQGNTHQMIFSFEQVIDFVLTHFPVTPGDLLLTGTPAGVGAFKKGDVLEAQLESKMRHSWKVL